MALLKFNRGKFAALSKQSLKDGSMWITTDTHQIFLDYVNNSGVLTREEIGNAGCDKGTTYGENTTAIGSTATAGRKVYYLKKIDFKNKKALITATKPSTVTSTTISTADDTTIPNADVAGKYAYIIYGDDAHIAKISSQSNNLLVFSELPTFDVNVYYDDAEQFSICVPGVPSWGSYEDLAPGAAALGQGTIAAGKGSFAAGHMNKAEHNFSTAFGNSNEVRATGGLAAGVRNQVEGYGSMATGYTNTVDDSNFAGAMGHSNNVKEADNSFALGAYNDIKGANSTALGNSNAGTGGSNTLIGNSLIGTGYQTVIGQFNEADEKNDKAFIIGAGRTDNYRKTIMSVDRNGNIKNSGNIDNPLIDKIKQGFGYEETTNSIGWDFSDPSYSLNITEKGLNNSQDTVTSWVSDMKALKITPASARQGVIFQTKDNFYSRSKNFNYCVIEYNRPYEVEPGTESTGVLFLGTDTEIFSDDYAITFSTKANSQWNTALVQIPSSKKRSFSWFRIDLSNSACDKPAYISKVKFYQYIGSDMEDGISQRKEFFGTKPKHVALSNNVQIGNIEDTGGHYSWRISNTGDILTSGSIVAPKIKQVLDCPYFQLFEDRGYRRVYCNLNEEIPSLQGDDIDQSTLSCENYCLKYSCAGAGLQQPVFQYFFFPLTLPLSYNNLYFRVRFRAHLSNSERNKEGQDGGLAAALMFNKGYPYNNASGYYSNALLGRHDDQPYSWEKVFEKTYSFSPTDQWRTLIIPCTWTEVRIDSFRFDPIQNLYPGEYIEISGFGFFKTETAANNHKDLVELMGVN